jgi:putative two-component system response regulator
VADAFDALVSDRPYKKAWKLDAALAYLREHAGIQFDPKCVNAFFVGLPEILHIRVRHQDADADTAPIDPR